MLKWLRSFFNSEPPKIYGRTGLKHNEPIDCSDCGKTIQPGRWVMWDEPSYYYGETDPYCMKCTKKDERIMQETDWEALAKESDREYQARRKAQDREA